MFRPLIFLLLLASSASAGPWPRAEGEGFLSFSFDTDAYNGTDNFLSFYLEYGLSRRRTLGIDRRESTQEIAKTVAFLRWPLTSDDATWKLAYELGVGVVDNHAALRPGVSIGRGLELGKTTGWMTLDARGLIYDELEDGLIESEFTVGLNATDRTKVIFQLQAGFPEGEDPYAKLAPSLVIRQNANRHFVIGVTAGIVEVDDLKVNLGLWQEF